MLRAAPRMRALLAHCGGQRLAAPRSTRGYVDVKGSKPTAPPTGPLKPKESPAGDVPKGKVQGATEIKRQPEAPPASEAKPQQPSTGPTPKKPEGADAAKTGEERPMRVVYRHEQANTGSSSSGGGALSTALIAGGLTLLATGGYLYYKLHNDDFNEWFAKNVPLIGKSIAHSVHVPRKDKKATAIAYEAPPRLESIAPAGGARPLSASKATPVKETPPPPPPSPAAEEESFAQAHTQPSDVDAEDVQSAQTAAVVPEDIDALRNDTGPRWHAESAEGAPDVAVQESAVEIGTAMEGPEVVAEIEKEKGAQRSEDAGDSDDDIYFRAEDATPGTDAPAEAVRVLVEGTERVAEEAMKPIDNLSLPVDASLSQRIAHAVVANDAHAVLGDALRAEFPETLEDAKERIAVLEYALEQWRRRDEERLARAVLEQQEEDGKRFKAMLDQQRSSVRATFEAELDKVREEFAAAVLRDRAAAETQHANELHKVLRRQAALQDSHMRERLAAQEKDLTSRMASELQDRIAQERAVRMQQLETLFGRLRALELVLSEEVSEGAIRGRAHQLWLAARALSHAANAGDPERISAAVRALSVAGQDDEAVVVALSNFPAEALVRPIPTDDDLRRRFAAVKKHAHRASLMPEDGGMVSHALSAVFSALLFTPKGPVEGDDVDAILARAEDALSHGDLETATRHVNQLRGWPRKLAYDWLKDARTRLELVQAVRMVDAEVTLKATSMS